MFEQFLSLPDEVRALSSAHLRAAQKAFAAVPEAELTRHPDLHYSDHPGITTDSSVVISSKVLGLMHLALARPYVSKDGRLPSACFFGSRDALAIARMLKAYNPDEPRVPAGSGPTSGQWTGGGSDQANSPLPNQIVTNGNDGTVNPAVAPAQSEATIDSTLFNRPIGVPDNWPATPTRQPGIQFTDPNNFRNYVRIMQGSPNNPHPNSQQPYVRWQLNEQALDADGNMLPTAKTPEAHIPIEDFEFIPELFDF